MRRRIGSAGVGGILIGVGLIILLFDWFSWSQGGPLSWPFDFLLAVGAVAMILWGISATVATGETGEKQYLGLRTCGGLTALFGLGLVALAFWGGNWASQQIAEAKAKGQAVTGSWDWMLYLLLGVTGIVVGIGTMRLRSVAVYSAIPFGAFVIWMNRINLHEANPIAMGVCAFFGLVIYLAIAFVMQNRTAN